MKRFFFILLAGCAMLSASAVDIDYSNTSKMAAGLKLGMSTRPTLDVEIELSDRPFRYIGANAAFVLITPFNSKKNLNTEFIEENDIRFLLDNYKESVYRMAGKVGLQFTTPAVMLSKDEMGLSLRVSPGIVMPIPSNKTLNVNKYELFHYQEIDQESYYNLISQEKVTNSGAKFCYWYVRSELVLEYEENWEFAVGYTYSTFDLYGGSRNVIISDTPVVITEKKPQHNISLGLTFKF